MPLALESRRRLRDPRRHDLGSGHGRQSRFLQFIDAARAQPAARIGEKPLIAPMKGLTSGEA